MRWARINSWAAVFFSAKRCDVSLRSFFSASTRCFLRTSAFARSEAASASALLRSPSTLEASCLVVFSSRRFASKSRLRRSRASRKASSLRREKSSVFLRDNASFKSLSAFSRACSRNATCVEITFFCLCCIASSSTPSTRRVVDGYSHRTRPRPSDWTASANCVLSSPMRFSSCFRVVMAATCWASAESGAGAPGSRDASCRRHAASSSRSCATTSTSFPR